MYVQVGRRTVGQTEVTIIPKGITKNPKSFHRREEEVLSSVLQNSKLLPLLGETLRAIILALLFPTKSSNLLRFQSYENAVLYPIAINLCVCCKWGPVRGRRRRSGEGNAL